MNVTKLGLPADLSPAEKIRAQMAMNTGNMTGGAMYVTPEEIHAMFETNGAVISEKPKTGGRKKTRKGKRSITRKSAKRR